MARFFLIFLRILLAFIFIAITLAAAAYMFPQQFLTIDSGETKADELVVLGGGDGRAERAAELYRQGAAPGVLVTGYGDCASNVLVLERAGVPVSVITPEPNALSTLENAQLAIPLLRKMGARRVILVTSWFHSRRALATFQHVAPDLQFSSRPSYLGYQPRQLNRAGFSEHVNIEYLKMLDYWFSHGVCPL
jgi:uncharacterized SAM-binding protein YcdF (DUF218 family)